MIKSVFYIGSEYYFEMDIYSFYWGEGWRKSVDKMEYLMYFFLMCVIILN